MPAGSLRLCFFRVPTLNVGGILVSATFGLGSARTDSGTDWMKCKWGSERGDLFRAGNVKNQIREIHNHFSSTKAGSRTSCSFPS